jgi:hypothetical protein
VKRFLLGLLLAGLAFPALADLRRETEPNDPAAMAQPIVPPTSVGGTISGPGDIDRYAVRLEGGQTLQADILARGFRAGAAPGSALVAVLEISGPTAASHFRRPGTPQFIALSLSALPD